MKTSEAIQAVIDGQGLVRAKFDEQGTERIEICDRRVVCTEKVRFHSPPGGHMTCIAGGFKIRDDWYLERDKPQTVTGTSTVFYSETDAVSKVVSDSRKAGDEVSNAVQSVLIRWHGPVKLTYTVEAIDYIEAK